MRARGSMPQACRRWRLPLLSGGGALLLLAVVQPWAMPAVKQRDQAPGPRRERQGADDLFALAEPDRCGPDAAVLDFVKSNGGTVHAAARISAAAREGAAERQIEAAADIDAGVPLLSVPPSLHMSLEKLRRHRTLSSVLAAVDALDSSLFGLTFLLLSEAADVSSFWRPYLCTLPRRPPLPLLMDDSDLEITRRRLPEQQRQAFDTLLQSQRSRVDAFRRKVVVEVMSRFPGRFRESDYSLARVRWAMAIIFSRAFPSKTSRINSSDDDPDSWLGAGGMHALTPGADMPNHANSSLPMRQLPDDSVVLRASGRLRAGDPVTISYGSKCNAHFLVQYGFLPKHNGDMACHDEQTVRPSETFLSLFKLEMQSNATGQGADSPSP